MTIESILVATDLARPQDAAIDRAWRIAHTHGATVKLMHMPPEGLRAAAFFRGQPAWEDFFCGSVAHRVLSWGSSDVLLVPQDNVPASAPSPRRRIGDLVVPANARSARRRPS
jgi:nucleotide-binding universal stress UspA family protein